MIDHLFIYDTLVLLALLRHNSFLSFSKSTCLRKSSLFSPKIFLCFNMLLAAGLVLIYRVSLYSLLKTAKLYTNSILYVKNIFRKRENKSNLLAFCSLILFLRLKVVYRLTLILLFAEIFDVRI